MNENLSLGRIAGIHVGLNWSLLVVAALIAWSLATGILPPAAPGEASAAYWTAGVVSALVFLASLLAHELAHSIVAARRGVRVEGITLWLFGGVSKLGGDAGTPAIEATVAIVGPLTSLSVAVVVALVGLAVGAAGAPAILVAGLCWLAGINVALGLFNLVPGFPLDGGRLLRALLWRWRGDRVRAT